MIAKPALILLGLILLASCSPSPQNAEKARALEKLSAAVDLEKSAKVDLGDLSAITVDLLFFNEPPGSTAVYALFNADTPKPQKLFVGQFTDDKMVIRRYSLVPVNQTLLPLPENTRSSGLEISTYFKDTDLYTETKVFFIYLSQWKISFDYYKKIVIAGPINGGAWDAETIISKAVDFDAKNATVAVRKILIFS